MQGARAQETARRYALGYLKLLKIDINSRKVRDRARIVAAEQYDSAEYIARLALAGKAQKVLDRIAAAARAGQLDANDLDRAKLKGIAGDALSDFSASLLVRNVLSAAYNAGYFEQGLADNTKHFWLYQTRRDDRVRPGHRVWEGLLLRKNDPLAKRIFPPNGHGCRCRMVAIAKTVAERLLKAGQATTKRPKLLTKTYVDKVTGKRIRVLQGIDPGWEGPPDDTVGKVTALLERQLQQLEATDV